MPCLRSPRRCCIGLRKLRWSATWELGPGEKSLRGPSIRDRSGKPCAEAGIVRFGLHCHAISELDAVELVDVSAIGK